MLTVDEDQPLVPLVLQGTHFVDQLLVAETVTDCAAQRAAETAVLTVIDAVVADIKGSEEHYTVAVHRAFELPGCLEYLVQTLGGLDSDERSRLLDRQRLFGKGFL